MEAITPDIAHRDMLARGEVITVDGKIYREAPGALEKGDLYFAERSGGPKVLTVRKVDHMTGWVYPEEPDHAYELFECVKVEEV